MLSEFLVHDLILSVANVLLAACFLVLCMCVCVVCLFVLFPPEQGFFIQGPWRSKGRCWVSLSDWIEAM